MDTTLSFFMVNIYPETLMWLRESLLRQVCTPVSNLDEKKCMKYDTCFLTLSVSTCAIIGQDGHYAVVDSHARSVDGIVDENGKSVDVNFSCLDHHHYFSGLYATLPGGFVISGAVKFSKIAVTCERSRLSDTADRVEEPSRGAFPGGTSGTLHVRFSTQAVS